VHSFRFNTWLGIVVVRRQNFEARKAGVVTYIQHIHVLYNAVLILLFHVHFEESNAKVPSLVKLRLPIFAVLKQLSFHGLYVTASQ